jgi:putative nucleotidyltransferase with HDIG domain
VLWRSEKRIKMLSKFTDFFKPPNYENLELTQKAKFLHFTLLVTSAACLLLGFLNISEETFLDEILFIFAGIVFLCIPLLNKRKYYLYTSLFVSALLLVVITFTLIDGIGLKDAGLIAYPLFIIFSSFLLSKKAALVTTFASICSIVLVYYLDLMGYLDPAEFSNEAQLKVIIVLIVATGIFLWLVMDDWEQITLNLRDTYDLTLSGWGKALEYRDQETEGHSQRVTELTVKLAQRFGISGQELEHIQRGALLHDIGKMAIPDEILLKNGGLTSSEWEVVKKHPENAKNFLEDIPYLKPALDIPYGHHERWDGSGYPQGLSKNEIPFSARLFAIIDVWDALISDRPYRQAWPAEKVQAYIREQSGKRFDPNIVEIFLEILSL